MSTFVERMNQTDAMRKRHDARFDKDAPASPSLALAAYRKRAEAFISKAERILGDPSIPIDQAQRELLRFPWRGVADRAGRLAQSSARRALAKMVGHPFAVDKAGDEAVRGVFIAEQERLFAKLVGDVSALAVHDIERALRVLRWRTRLIASDQTHNIQSEAMRHYALAYGYESYKWVTREDERVRPGHRELHGTIQLWSQPPITGPNEGHHHPGQAVNCRCHAVVSRNPT